MKTLARLIACSIIWCSSLLGQNTWTSMNGPWYASDARDMAIATDAIFAVGGPGRMLVKSTDYGVTWQQISSQINIYCVAAVKIGSTYTVFVGHDNGSGTREIRRSTDGGGSWSPVFTGLETRPNRISISPLSSNVIYLGLTEKSGVAATVLYWSSSGGGPGSWYATSLGNKQTTITDIVVNPSDGTKIYVSGWSTTGNSAHEGIWRTINGGSTWTHPTSGLTNKSIGALTINPSNPQILYCGTYQGSYIIYKSTNGATSWTGTVFGDATPQVRDMRVYTPTPTTILAATTKGIWKETGSGWYQETATGLNDTYCQALGISTSSGNKVFCGTSGAFYESGDVAATFTERTATMARIDPTALVISGSNVYATGSVGNSPGGLVFKSTNSGATWNVMLGNIELASGNILEGNDIVINRSVPSTLILGCRLFGSAAPRILRSTNSGGNWAYTYNPVVSGTVNQIVYDPANSNNVYAVGSEGGVGKEFRSLNGGVSWGSPITIGGTEMLTVAIDRATPSTLYAAGTTGAYKSVNSGTSWSTSGLSGLTVTSLSVNPNVTSTIYAGTTTAGVYKTINNGGSWTNTDLFSPTQSSNVSSLFLHPANSTALYASGTDGGSPFLYKNSHAINGSGPETDGFPGGTLAKVVRMDPGPSGWYTLFASTSSGMYKKTHQWDGSIEGDGTGLSTVTWDNTKDIQVGSMFFSVITNSPPTTILTVPSGKTLSINIGSVVKFLYGTQMEVYGTLAANTSTGAITYFQPLNPATETWAGIKIDSPGIANFKYCDFYRSPEYYTVENNGSGTSRVDYSTFRDCLGMRYSNINLGSATVLASYNRFTVSSFHPYYGVAFHNTKKVGIDNCYISGFRGGILIENQSEPGFHADTVTGNGFTSFGGGTRTGFGVGVFDGSTPKFGKFSGTEAGNNLIHLNDTVEVLVDNSTVFFGDGTNPSYGNRIFEHIYFFDDVGPGRRIRALNNSVVTAEYVYWGGSCPVPSYYFAELSGSTIDRDPCVGLDPPVLITPIGGAHVPKSGSTLFDWEAVTGATIYRLQEGTDPTFIPSSLERDDGGLTTSSEMLNGFATTGSHYWRVNARSIQASQDKYISSWTVGSFYVDPPPETAIGEGTDEAIPTRFDLAQNYPNPFNPTTRLDYALPVEAHVKIRVFNVAGQVVATVVDAVQSAGYKTVEFDGSDLPSGIYFYRIMAGSFVDLKKMILMK